MIFIFRLCLFPIIILGCIGSSICVALTWLIDNTYDHDAALKAGFDWLQNINKKE